MQFIENVLALIVALFAIATGVFIGGWLFMGTLRILGVV